MTDKVKIVLNGYAHLSESEKTEFIREINDYINKSDFQKGQLNEKLSGEVKRVLGPTSSAICSCCGR